MYPKPGHKDPPTALRNAANLLDRWVVSGGEDDACLNDAFAEICALHDSMHELLKRKPQFAKVLKIREEQLRKLLEY